MTWTRARGGYACWEDVRDYVSGKMVQGVKDYVFVVKTDVVHRLFSLFTT
jgi:hypothetical protein